MTFLAHGTNMRGSAPKMCITTSIHEKMSITLTGNLTNRFTIESGSHIYDRKGKPELRDAISLHVTNNPL